MITAAATAPRAAASLGLGPGHYHYQLSGAAHAQPNGLAAGFLTAATGPVALISSDDVVRLFDPARLAEGSSGAGAGAHAATLGKHADVTSLAPLAGTGSPGHGFMTAGRDGMIRHWDARAADTSSSSSPTWQRPTKLQAAYLSLASCAGSSLWAAGTELAGSTATVEVWDSRRMSAPLASYVECHSDDVSSLAFSLCRAGCLVSGSTDGLVNAYAPSFPADEDDALLQVVNHGSSIHQAGLLGAPGGGGQDDMLFALSHDETLSVYRREDSNGSASASVEMNTDSSGVGVDGSGGGSGSDDLRLAVFGDVRGRLGCNYVAEILPRRGGFCIAAGNLGEQRLDLVDVPRARLQHSPPGLGGVWRFGGAHGDEIVRSVLPYVAGAGAGLLTAGEDGMVRLWPLESDDAAGQDPEEDDVMDEDGAELDRGGAKEHKAKRRRSDRDARERKHFKPY